MTKAEKTITILISFFMIISLILIGLIIKKDMDIVVEPYEPRSIVIPFQIETKIEQEAELPGISLDEQGWIDEYAPLISDEEVELINSKG